MGFEVIIRYRIILEYLFIVVLCFNLRSNGNLWNNSISNKHVDMNLCILLVMDKTRVLKFGKYVNQFLIHHLSLVNWRMFEN